MSADVQTRPATTPEPDPSGRRAGELTPVELLRWTWRQLTSMRTALVLLLLLAVAAIPGSVIPQEDVDAFGVSQWREENPDLAPVFDRIGMFDVYGSVWFSAIYLLLMVSLVGCIVPRTLVYAKSMRAQPPRTPKRLERIGEHASFTTAESPDAVLAKARESLRGYRFRRDDDEAAPDSISAERGYLREAGNLVFHLAVLVVLVGFGLGALYGYKGGVIIVEGNGFANDVGQYDDFVPGSLFSSDSMEPFAFTVEDFDVEWLRSGPGAGTARAFSAELAYTEAPGEEEQRYDLQVNNPLAIGGTELFLIGHGYAPVITVRDGNGEVAYSGPTIFLPEDPSFRSFGVVKAPDAQPEQIGLEGLFYPTFLFVDGDPITVSGEAMNPTVSMLVYAGDLSMDSGPSQSVYTLVKDEAEQLVDPTDGDPLRLDLQPGQTAELPDGLGEVTFEGVEPWTRIQISKTPGKLIALGGVVAGLLGLLGSLFIRSRRVWVRARPADDGADGTMVEVSVLDRTGGGEPDRVLAELVEQLKRDDTEVLHDAQDTEREGNR